jgi:predicted transcriptional regulator
MIELKEVKREEGKVVLTFENTHREEVSAIAQIFKDRLRHVGEAKLIPARRDKNWSIEVRGDEVVLEFVQENAKAMTKEYVELKKSLEQALLTGAEFNLKQEVYKLVSGDYYICELSKIGDTRELTGFCEKYGLGINLLKGSYLKKAGIVMVGGNEVKDEEYYVVVRREKDTFLIAFKRGLEFAENPELFEEAIKVLSCMGLFLAYRGVKGTATLLKDKKKPFELLNELGAKMRKGEMVVFADGINPEKELERVSEELKRQLKEIAEKYGLTREGIIRAGKVIAEEIKARRKKVVDVAEGPTSPEEGIGHSRQALPSNRI